MVVNIEQKEGKRIKKDYSKEGKKKNQIHKKTVFLTLLVISLFLLSGCFNSSFFSSKITYESSAVTLSYDISYGYHINLSGKGEATVTYKEYLPQTNNGTHYFLTIEPEKKYENNQNGNKKIIWNQTLPQKTNQSYQITANIIQKPIVITDLTGKKALTLTEIHTKYPIITSSYTHSIGNKTQTIIHPNHPTLSTVAHTIKNNSKSTNAFLLGKNIFSWLKNNTEYEKHGTYHPQPAINTFSTGIGDCDDLTYLYLSLCRAIKLPCRYIKGYIISNTTAVPHVWAEIFVGKQLSKSGWIPVECAGTGSCKSEIHNHYGIEDVQHLRLCIDDGSNETFQELTNPLQVKYDQTAKINISRFESIKNYSVLSSKKLTIKNNHRMYE